MASPNQQTLSGVPLFADYSNDSRVIPLGDLPEVPPDTNALDVLMMTTKVTGSALYMAAATAVGAARVCIRAADYTAYLLGNYRIVVQWPIFLEQREGNPPQ